MTEIRQIVSASLGHEQCDKIEAFTDEEVPNELIFSGGHQ